LSSPPQNFTSKQILDTQRALVAQLTAQVKGDQAAIDNAKTNLDYTTITSPIPGCFRSTKTRGSRRPRRKRRPIRLSHPLLHSRSKNFALDNLNFRIGFALSPRDNRTRIEFLNSGDALFNFDLPPRSEQHSPQSRQCRRLHSIHLLVRGRITQGALVLGWALLRVDVRWTPVNVLMVPMMLLSGAALFGAVFVAGGAFQFWANDASQAQNSVTYGGNTMLQYPPTVFSRELVRGVTFVVPLAFVNWLPALHVLGEPDPLGLPAWVDFASPVVAAICCALAGLAWRAGLRSYRSTGS